MKESESEHNTGNSIMDAEKGDGQDVARGRGLDSGCTMNAQGVESKENGEKHIEMSEAPSSPIPVDAKSNVTSHWLSSNVFDADEEYKTGALNRIKTMLVRSETESSTGFNPETAGELESSSNMVAELYKKYTIWWLGNRFKKLKTELKFLNEHTVLNRRTVYAGYAFQIFGALMVMVLSVILLRFNATFCEKEPLDIRDACIAVFGERKININKTVIGVGCYTIGLVITGILAHWYIHYSQRFVNKAWALVVAWSVYAAEMIGISFIFVYTHEDDVFWSLKLAITFTAIFMIAVWFNGLMFWQTSLLFVITFTIYYATTIPFVDGVLKQMSSGTLSEDVASAYLIDSTMYSGTAPVAAVFAIIALAGSYLSEQTARMRFLERLLITHQQNNVIRQKTKNERMQRSFLENMLPATIVDDLQGISYSIQAFEKLSKRCQGASILFADIAGFTSFATQVDSSIVMRFLNDLFLHFDSLCDRHNVYKVETVGDCYVAAVGVVTGQIISTEVDEDQLESSKVLFASKCNTKDMLSFAKAMISASRLVIKPKLREPALMRVGIHTGPCMSGIVGTRNLRYCLFGDTMNTAARMEQTGVVDAIHVSDVVADLVPDESWESRGSVTVKGKGAMETYLLHMEV